MRSFLLKVLMVTVFCLSLAACGERESSTETIQTEESASSKEENDGDEAESENLGQSEQESESSESTEQETEIANSTEPEPETEETVEQKVVLWIESHSLEAKVAQMFIITPEALTGVGNVTAAGEQTKTSIENCPVGGLLYFASNLQNREQVGEMLRNTTEYYDEIDMPRPFLSVDEEGGRVTRIAENANFGVPSFPSMSEIGSTGDVTKATEIGTTIGSYLKDLGFNMDYAPVADVLSNSENTVIGNRSFGSDAEMVSQMVIAESDAMFTEGIIPVIKHFPGHGATESDSHTGYAATGKTIDELMQCELIPFKNSIENGIEAIMVGHISVPNITGDYTPASLSEYMISTVLRDNFGFDGIVITDAMNMGAVSNNYSSGSAAVLAIKAGVDIVLMPADFQSAYNGVISAVQSGEISEERINESVNRILKLKYELLYETE
ncbi:MAG: glycoside hydrolase family 3 protein [Lachnospiraceae bacterium]|nr:glycoside hydrolase family 3 protein [Lachnospiraceae bacterium]